MSDSNAPTGFIAFEKNGVRGFVRNAAQDPLIDAFCSETPVNVTVKQPVGGRGGLRRIETPMGPAIVRAYRRGGFLRHFVKETYLRNRPIKEFRVHLEAQRRGVSVPEVLGVAFRRYGIGFRGCFATLEIPGSHLLEVLRREGKESGRALRMAAEAVRQMHDLGIDHADPQLMNLQWDGERAYLLDLDNARALDPLPKSIRAANLRRLQRSFQKHGFHKRFREFEVLYQKAGG